MKQLECIIFNVEHGFSAFIKSLIKLGPETGNDIVVRSGLNGNETIIVEGLQKVQPGMAASVTLQEIAQ